MPGKKIERICPGKKYINAYETVYEYDEDGRETRRVNYRGDIYEIVTDEVNIKKYKMTQIIIVVLVFLIQLALGLSTTLVDAYYM